MSYPFKLCDLEFSHLCKDTSLESDYKSACHLENKDGSIANRRPDGAVPLLFHEAVVIITIIINNNVAPYKMQYKLKSTGYISLTNHPHPFLQGH